MNLCSSFKRIALATWDLIEKGSDAGVQLKEETLTDLILLELKTRNANSIFVHEFNKPNESSTGADWEWWFYGYERWLGFRVQAKIVNTGSGQFEHLHYRKNSKSAYQCDRLIADASKTSFPKRPIYCLYVHTKDRSTLGRMVRRYRVAELFGCSLLSAHDVQQYRLKKLKGLAQIESRMVPWHCLVCLTPFDNRTILQRIDRLAAAYFDGDSMRDTEFLLMDCPSYVKTIATSEKAFEINPPDEHLSGVVVFLLSDFNG